MEQQKAQIWAVISHLGGLLAYACFLGIIIPLFIWLLKGDQDIFVNQQSKEALNFQISFTIYNSIGWILLFTVIGAPLALIWWLIIWAVNIICSIKGAVRTSKGLNYRYPMNLRLIR